MVRFEHWLNRQWLRRGAWARLMWPLHRLMQGVVVQRRRAHLDGRCQSQRLPVPVLVVGNRIVGGAGKTPTTLAVLGHLQAQGWRPGVLSRGHGRQAADQALVLDQASAGRLDARRTGDEPWLIHHQTGLPVGIGAHRLDGGRALLHQHPDVDIVVCDDALQHLALQRDIEIVVFDERGAGNGWLLPAGLLREPLDAPAGPGTTQPPLVLYNADRASTPLPGHRVDRGLRPLQTLADWREGLDPTPGTLAAGLGAKAQDTWALAGIAQPERFFTSLRALGLNFTPFPLTDHAGLDPLPWPASVQHLIVTEKDAVKITPEALARERPLTQVWVARQRFEPEPAFWAALDQRLAALPRGAPSTPRHP